VLPLVDLALVVDLAEVEPVLEHAPDDRDGEQLVAGVALSAGVVALPAMALVVEPAGDLHGGPHLDVLVEDEAHQLCLTLVDGEVPLALRVVPQGRMPTVPQPPSRPRLHRYAGAVCRLLALQLGEHQDELQHRPPHRRRRVERLVQRHELDRPLLEGPMELEEVQQRPGQTVEPSDQHQVDLPTTDGMEHPLELGAVQGLARRPLLPEDLHDLMVPRPGV